MFGSNDPACRELTVARPFRPRPRVRLSSPERATQRLAARVPALLAARDAAPTSRRAHADLVHAALAAGDVRALEFARAWAAADPDHAPALDALADALARAGDRLHLRTRAGMADADPFRTRTHERLARAFEAAGDLARACSHRRAVVSIDPSDLRAWRALASCHVKAGEARRARDLLADGAHRPSATHRSSTARGRARPLPWPSRVARLLRELDEGRFAVANEPSWPRAPAVDLELTWSGDADLDLGLMDERGRLDGPTHPRARWELVGTDRPGYARVTLRRPPRALFVEITPMAGTSGATRATLTVRAGGKTRTYPVEISGGTVRVVRISRG